MNTFSRINNITAQNKLIKGIIWCLRTCFFFLEKLIRYLNRSVKLSELINNIITMQNLQERVHHDGNGGIELLQSFPGRLHPNHLEHPSWLLCQPGECFDLKWWYPWLDIYFMTPTGGWLCHLAWKDLRGWVDHPLLQVRSFGKSDLSKLTKLMASVLRNPFFSMTVSEQEDELHFRSLSDFAFFQ